MIDLYTAATPKVVLTSGGIDKLAVYQGLGVREVWFWKDGTFQLHVLEGDSYHQVERSRLLPDLDFDVLARFVALGDQHEAVNRYRDWLQGVASRSHPPREDR